MAETSSEIGQRLRTQWFSALKEIADLELQRTTWLDAENQNPHWSYIEFVCCYPDRDQIQTGESEGWLSPTEAGILLDFGKTLLAYNAPGGKDYDHRSILDDIEWQTVTSKARAALGKMIEPK